MADTVSFTTFDDLPKSLAVTKAALYGSKVFRDMLDIGSSTSSSSSSAAKGSDAEPVPLAETTVEVIPFFEILEGKADGLDMDKWPDEAWESLARLSDKYDVEVARLRVQVKIYELLEVEAPDLDPLLAFTLAAHLHDPAFIAKAARPALSALVDIWSPAFGPEFDKVRKERFKSSQKRFRALHSGFWVGNLECYCVELMSSAEAAAEKYDSANAAEKNCGRHRCSEEGMLDACDGFCDGPVHDFDYFHIEDPFCTFFDDMQGDPWLANEWAVCALHYEIVRWHLQCLDTAYREMRPVFDPAK
ncbi:hypothetical protein JCM8547_004223 [Rhodosporidiobolus lusitaniae]